MLALLIYGPLAIVYAFVAYVVWALYFIDCPPHQQSFGSNVAAVLIALTWPLIPLYILIGAR